MTKPFFSIVTITRNNLSGLQRTHRSLEKQAFDNYEWIIIDGYSYDSTIDYLKTFIDASWISEPDEGLYDAMNKGIHKATGKYIWFMNAGDEFSNEHILYDIYRTVCHTNNDFIYGDAVEENFYKKARSRTQCDWGMFTHHQSMIYRLSMLKNRFVFLKQAEFHNKIVILAVANKEISVVRMECPQRVITSYRQCNLLPFPSDATVRLYTVS